MSTRDAVPAGRFLATAQCDTGTVPGTLIAKCRGRGVLVGIDFGARGAGSALGSVAASLLHTPPRPWLRRGLPGLAEPRRPQEGRAQMVTAAHHSSALRVTVRVTSRKPLPRLPPPVTSARSRPSPRQALSTMLPRADGSPQPSQVPPASHMRMGRLPDRPARQTDQRPCPHQVAGAPWTKASAGPSLGASPDLGPPRGKIASGFPLLPSMAVGGGSQ